MATNGAPQAPAELSQAHNPLEATPEQLPASEKLYRETAGPRRSARATWPRRSRSVRLGLGLEPAHHRVAEDPRESGRGVVIARHPDRPEQALEWRELDAGIQGRARELLDL